LPYATSASDGSAVPTNIYTIGLLLISTSVITYVASIRIIKIDTQHTSMKSRLNSEQMESVLYNCIIDKAPCKLGNNLDEIRDLNGRTLLHWVVNLSLKEETEYLLSLGVNPNEKDDEGQTPLHYAAAGENVDIVMMLLNRGADVNARDNKGRIPLHYAKKQEVAELLIKYGSNVNATDYQGNVPLHTVGPDVIEILLKYGANPNIKNNSGLPPIYYQLQRSCKAAVKLLYATSEDVVGIKDEYGNTLLHVATGHGCKEAIRWLARHIDVNSRNRDGNTPLHIATFERDTEIIRLLINLGANVNAPNNNGMTPLQFIAAMCRKEFNCSDILEVIPVNELNIDIILKHAFNVEQLKLLRLLYNRGIMPSLLSILSQI